MKYRGYRSRVEYDDQAKIFHGEFVDTKDVIAFQSTSVDEIEKALWESVDDYLAFCRERGEKPDKPFSGKLVLRVPTELHHKLYIQATRVGKSIDNWLVDVIKDAVE